MLLVVNEIRHTYATNCFICSLQLDCNSSVTHKYLFFKKLALLWGQSICFCDKRYDIDFVVESLHELDVQWLQTEGWAERKL